MTSLLLQRKGLIVFLGLMVLIGASALFHPEAVSAHPLGNFTINRYTRIELPAGQVYLQYVLDMAEIPTFQEMAKIDLDRNGEASDQERGAYLASKVPELMSKLYLTVDGSPVPLNMVTQELSFPPGQGGLSTLRLSLMLRGQIMQTNQQAEHDLYYRDDNYAERAGWKEIVIKPVEGVSLLSSTAPQRDQSDELTSYPQDMLSSPPNRQEVRTTFVWRESEQTGSAEAAPPAAQAPGKSLGPLGSLVTAEDLSLPLIAAAFIAALGLGAAHAISPGHGKTIMAAYLVGTRGTLIHAVFLGLTVTVSHTLGVLGLGLVVLYASQIIAPEGLYPWLGIISGATIIGIGAWLLMGRLGGNRQGAHSHDFGTKLDLLNHAHMSSKTQRTKMSRIYLGVRALTGNLGHRHPHSHHDAGQTHHHSGQLQITWKSLTALGIVGGMLPSASALIILLAAISVHRAGFGLLLILAFSLGMAAILTGIGVLIVYAGRMVEALQFRTRRLEGFSRLIPIGTSVVIMISGIIVTARAAIQLGFY